MWNKYPQGTSARAHGLWTWLLGALAVHAALQAPLLLVFPLFGVKIPISPPDLLDPCWQDGSQGLVPSS